MDNLYDENRPGMTENNELFVSSVFSNWADVKDRIS